MLFFLSLLQLVYCILVELDGIRNFKCGPLAHASISVPFTFFAKAKIGNLHITFSVQEQVVQLQVSAK